MKICGTFICSVRFISFERGTHSSWWRAGCTFIHWPYTVCNSYPLLTKISGYFPSFFLCFDETEANIQASWPVFCYGTNAGNPERAKWAHTPIPPKEPIRTRQDWLHLGRSRIQPYNKCVFFKQLCLGYGTEIKVYSSRASELMPLKMSIINVPFLGMIRVGNHHLLLQLITATCNRIIFHL